MVACPECRAALPSQARFCAQCGARVAVAPHPVAGERRPVAILFADLAGFTKLTSELDAEEVHRLLGRFFEVVDGAISQLGGAVDKHMGDATMAVFGAPIAHGNDVERAVRAACAIHEAMAALSAEFRHPLATHIGIANGEVVAASTGSTVRADYTVTGDAVNLASRLEELADAGETIVSDDVRSALGPRLLAQSRGSVAVRGFAREIPIWSVRGLSMPPIESLPLIGRAHERARFEAIVHALGEHRRGRTLLVRGDPGVGKTRLAAWMLAHAEQAGCACHRAAILDFGATQKNEATNLLARSLLGLDASADAAAGRRALDAAIVQGLARRDHEPFLADLLAIPQSPDSPFDAMDHATRSTGRVDAIVALASLASRVRPTLLLVEDAHWASAPVIEVLAGLRDCTGGLPLVLVITTRRDGDPIGGTWPSDHFETLALEALSNEEAIDLATAFRATPPDVARRCVERAQGNPLFLTQLLENGAEGDAMPATIASVVLARLDRLPPQERTALQAASIAGQRFERALVDDLVGAAATLDDARTRGLVSETSGGDLMFSHALIRDAAYASLLHSARRTLHRRAAQWYADRDLALRAEHLQRAEDDAAPQAFLEASRSSVAAMHLDTALTLAQRGARLSASPDVAFALQMLAGEVARDIGRAGEAVAAFTRAAEVAATPSERSLACIGVASAHRLTSSVEQGLAALDVAQPIAETLRSAPQLARIAYLRGSLHFAKGDLASCADEHERALVHARAARDEACEAQALSGLADVLYANGRMASAHAAFSRCVELSDRRGDVRFTLMNRNMMALADLYLGHVPRALATIERARTSAKDIGHRVAEVMADEVAGLVLVGAGREQEAVAPVERSLALAREIASRRFAAIDLTLLGVIAYRAGDLASARARFDESWALLEEIGPRFAGPLMLAWRARTAASETERRECLASGEALLDGGSISHNHFWFREAAIDGSLDAGDLDEAERHADALERYASIEPTRWSAFIVARGRALAAARRGRPDVSGLHALRGCAGELGLHAAVPQLDEALVAASGRRAPTGF